MLRTTSRALIAVSAVVFTVVGAPAHGRDSLSVSANSPTVIVAPRDAGRSFMRLPSLEYVFEILAKCADGRRPKSVSLNVAHSRKSLAAEQIADDGPTEFNLRVPASQIAPLAVENFCVIDREQADDDLQTILSISSALSAQVSLRCESENEETMTYVSRSLGVSLVCNAKPVEEETRSE